MAIARAGLSAPLSERERERRREEEAHLFLPKSYLPYSTQRTGGAGALLFNYVC